jgi:hypothetical protein
LPRIEQRRTDHQVRGAQDAQHEGEGAVAVQSSADVGRRLRMPVEQHVLPRDQHVIEHHQRINLVEAIGERVVLGRCAAGKAGAADEFQIG